MQETKIQLPEIKLAGITCRTSNKAEIDPQVATSVASEASSTARLRAISVPLAVQSTSSTHLTTVAHPHIRSYGSIGREQDDKTLGVGTGQKKQNGILQAIKRRLHL